MRITFIFTGWARFTVGGFKVVYEYANRLAEREHDVSIVHPLITRPRQVSIVKKIVADGQSAIDALCKNSGQFDVVIMDYQIVGGITGETLIRKIKEVDPALQIIVITKMTINVTDFDFTEPDISYLELLSTAPVPRHRACVLGACSNKYHCFQMVLPIARYYAGGSLHRHRNGGASPSSPHWQLSHTKP